MTVLVTGSSRGIGKAIAARFLRDGHCVALNGTGQGGALWETEKELAAINPNVAAFAGDMSNYNSAVRVMDAASARFGAIDVLVNNAGLAAAGLFADMQPIEWQRLMDVNIGALLNASHIAARDMARRHSGVIINISSIWGVSGASCEAVYAMTKGAVNAFTKSLGKELGPCGVRVNAIACGMIDTEMNARLTDEEKEAFLNDVPLSRMGSVAEIADVASFLASADASYMTAQVLVVDGGVL